MEVIRSGIAQLCWSRKGSGYSGITMDHVMSMSMDDFEFYVDFQAKQWQAENRAAERAARAR